MDIDRHLTAPLTDSRVASYAPSWSPDGQQIVFYSDRDGGRDLYLTDAQGHNLRRLTDNHANNDGPVWSPDSRYIAFHSDQGDDYNIHLLNLADGSTRPLLPFDVYWDADPSFSPDGEQIVFVSTREQLNANLYVIDIDGHNLRRLTDNPAEDSTPEWSHDGAQIAFVARNVRDGGLKVHLMQADGGGLRSLGGARVGVVDQSPSWSPDGTRLVFASTTGGSFDIFMMNADGRSVRQLTTHPDDDWGPVWRP